MTWKRMSITIFLLIVFLNILQINIFLIFVFNSQSPGESTGGLRSDTIASIWFWELILGVTLSIIGGIYLILSQKRKKPSIVARSKQKSKGTVTLASTTGFNHISPFYKLEIENKTAMPLIDVTLDPILSEDSFELDENQKTIHFISPDCQKRIDRLNKSRQTLRHEFIGCSFSKKLLVSVPAAHYQIILSGRQFIGYFQAALVFFLLGQGRLHYHT